MKETDFVRGLLVGGIISLALWAALLFFAIPALAQRPQHPPAPSWGAAFQVGSSVPMNYVLEWGRSIEGA